MVELYIMVTDSEMCVVESNYYSVRRLQSTNIRLELPAFRTYNIILFQEQYHLNWKLEKCFIAKLEPQKGISGHANV